MIYEGGLVPWQKTRHRKQRLRKKRKLKKRIVWRIGYYRKRLFLFSAKGVLWRRSFSRCRTSCSSTVWAVRRSSFSAVFCVMPEEKWNAFHRAKQLPRNAISAWLQLIARCLNWCPPDSFRRSTVKMWSEVKPAICITSKTDDASIRFMVLLVCGYKEY